MPLDAGLHWVDSLTLASGSSISVDGTAALLVLLFLGLMLYLNQVLFQPYLRVKTLRQDRIAGVKAEAVATQERAEALLARYQSQMAEARSQALDLKTAARQSARKSQQEMTEQARTQAEEIIERTRRELGSAIEDAETELEAQAVALSSIIVNRVLPP